jgi:hypothetical protein
MVDSDKKGHIDINSFNKIIHSHKVYLSREELRKVEVAFGTGETNAAMGSPSIDYIKIS